MNILIMTRLLTSGGAERVAANLATELSERHKVKLVVFDGTKATYGCNVDVIDLKMPMQRNIIKKAIWYLKVLVNIYKIKKVNKITHTISFLNEADLINVLTPQGKRIVSVRSHRSLANKNIITYIKDKIVFRLADKIVALSKGVKEDLVKNYQIRSEMIDVIYNSCDTKKIQKNSCVEADQDYLNLLSGYDVVNAGRLVDEKGQWHLIRAFNKVVMNISNARLFILGIGPHEEYFKKIIRSYGLEGNVFLMGYKKNPYAYLRKGSVYVFSSVREGFGNIMLEAMACKLPIIAADCLYGPRELIEPQTSYAEKCVDRVKYGEYGILVPCCDEKYYMDEPLTVEENIMADEIIKILKNPKMQEWYREKSQERITDFSPEKIRRQWEKSLEI